MTKNFYLHILNRIDKTSIMDTSKNDILSIHVNTPGRLQQKIQSENYCNQTCLEIKGELNDEDVVYLGKWLKIHESISKMDFQATSGLLTIDHNAFGQCRCLKEIILPNGIRSIGDRAFEQCTSLESIKLPDTVESVGDRAFAGCEKLASINIPGLTSYIGVGTFYGCYMLRKVEVDKNNDRYDFFGDILFDKLDKTLLKYIPSKQVEGEFTTPQGVVHIGNYAFDGCNGLQCVNVNDGCTDLGERSFTKCLELKKIKLPSSFNHLSYNAFDGCEAFETIEVSEDNKTYTSMDGVLYSKDHLNLELCPKAKKSPFFFDERTTRINEGAFAGCQNIHSIFLPQHLASIQSKAFDGCSSLTFVSIPSETKEIGSFAFANCSSLKNIWIYSSVPPKCGVSPFAAVKTSDCILKVPIDSEIDYRKEYGWNGFKIINESLNLTLCSNFSQLRALTLAFKKAKLRIFG